MDPSEALTSFENALRLAIRTVLGDEWLSAGGAPDEAALGKRRAEEIARRDGANVSGDLLEYAMTTDLTNLVDRNWESFKPVFSDKKRTETYFGIVEDVRNTIAHGREVLRHEQDLLAGAAGQIRLQVSKYQSGANASIQYYPVIERITDHSGRGPDGPYLQMGKRYPRVNVGDVLRFRAYASGGRGHPVVWFVNPSRAVMPHFWGGLRPQTAGNEVDLEYTVLIDDVTEDLWITVTIRSDDSFQRETNGWDDSAVFRYAVNPPRW